MITKIAKFEDIGKFSSLIQEKNFTYGESDNCNIIFGFNGSGKTTLSNAMSFFADNSFISETEKTSIFDDIKNSATSSIELELQDRNKCKYPENQHNKSIYVFNSHFVSTHVFDGTKGNIKKFSNVASGEIKNESIESANKKISELESEKKSAETENVTFDESIKRINQKYSSSFNATLTDKGKRLTAPTLSKETLPSESLDELQEKLKKITADYELSKNQQGLSDDLLILNQFVFEKSTLDLHKLKAVLDKTVQQLSRDALADKIREINDLFEEESHKQSTERWFRFGKSILDVAKERAIQIKCPICDADISARLNEILRDFEGYFDKSYEAFISEIKTHKEQVQNTLHLIEIYVTNSVSFEKLLEKYKQQVSTDDFVTFDAKNVKSELTNIINACDAKISNIQFSYAISESIIDELSAMNVAIERNCALRNNVADILREKKLDRNKIEDAIRSIYKKIILLEFDSTDKSGAINRYKENQKKVSIIATANPENIDGLLFYQNRRREELKKLKVESKGISKFLKIMGIDHFIVDINEDAPNENIIVKYTTSGVDKNKLKNCLSDGEKTAVAFAYFLSKFENERDTDIKRKESVVVIDDPISSLDANRLYSTAHLVRDVFRTIRQLVLLSHNFLFLKFFNSAYGHRINCLFMDNGKLVELPDELRNFESPYFYMLKSVIEFSESTNADSYQNAKKYLPNYIRRVLETFLSFKFAKVVNRRGGSHSPGLSDFKGDVDDLDLEDTMKQGLKRNIENIVKVTDQHSHGNAQLTEENFYITEDELRALAQNAIEVIEILDGVHKAAIAIQ